MKTILLKSITGAVKGIGTTIIKNLKGSTNITVKTNAKTVISKLKTAVETFKKAVKKDCKGFKNSIKEDCKTFKDNINEQCKEFKKNVSDIAGEAEADVSINEKRVFTLRNKKVTIDPTVLDGYITEVVNTAITVTMNVLVEKLAGYSAASMAKA